MRLIQSLVLVKLIPRTIFLQGLAGYKVCYISLNILAKITKF